MLAADHCLSYDVALRKHELFEIHRSKISLHHTKAGYNYPMIRCRIRSQSLQDYERVSTKPCITERLPFS
jgi:hypothetical protein